MRMRVESDAEDADCVILSGSGLNRHAWIRGGLFNARTPEINCRGRRGMKNLWLYVVCNLAVGVSLALPLFLLFRERRLERTGGA